MAERKRRTVGGAAAWSYDEIMRLVPARCGADGGPVHIDSFLAGAISALAPGARRDARMAQGRTSAGAKGAEKKRATAARVAAPYVKEARALRRRHPDWSLRAIAANLYIRKPPATERRTLRQITRYLRAGGLR